ncbi:MAG: imidazole glycerol phosphate synthase subunit HisF [Micavibrio aeruginosavorus]|uniref:Imidazole glycerol phosphate synthase subunit HisF n=1 Tax=Micavibrio aeruginosavorus TaxID=349221 RepID=A0A2W5PYT3_9BACT|nr:MAG: imidazole glycerol phosphate synthase subunit HisF [Micavibrio aeruginosavorus]
MLKVRVIPCLDVDKGRVVKGISFGDFVDAGDPVEQAMRYNDMGADELTFLDITASHEGRDTIHDVVRRTADCCFMPLTVGGGVRTLDDVRKLLDCGADKISVMTTAILNPQFVKDATNKCGSQCIVVAIDSKKKEDGAGWEVYTHGGRKATGVDTIEFAKRMADYGAGEILLNSIDQDGQKTGFDLVQTRAVADAVSIPVIASGGVGKLQHFVDGVKEGHASAVLAASVFHFGTFTIGEVKTAMNNASIPVRI